MKNKICLELLVFVLISSFFSTPAQAIYKKKVLVGKFQNPAQWDKSYDPGIIISEMLNQELIHKKGIQLISISKNIQKLMNNDNSSSSENFVEPTVFDNREPSFPAIELIQNTGSELMKSPTKIMPAKNPMDDDPLWPAKLGKKVHKSTFIEIRGKVIKFMPDNRRSDSDVSLRSKTSENAEVAVNVELIQHNTGRVLHEKTFRKVSRFGNEPFSIEKIRLTNMNRRDGLSSMNSALMSLKSAVGEFVSDKIDDLPLEGEIVATNKKNDERNHYLKLEDYLKTWLLKKENNTLRETRRKLVAHRKIMLKKRKNRSAMDRTSTDKYLKYKPSQILDSVKSEKDVTQIKSLERQINRFRSHAQKILHNVCKGEFPGQYWK